MTATDLDRFDMFRGLSPSARAALAGRCRRVRAARNDMIIDQLAEERDVYFVLSGAVRAVIFSASGREVSFRDIAAGGLFGEFAALDGGPRSACVIATRPTEVLRMPQDVFRAAVFGEPAVLDVLLRHLIGLLRHYTDRVIELGTLPVAGRVHAEILRLARAGAGAAAKRFAIVPFPTHAELAARLGTHREAVTRELSRLADAGIVATARGRLDVLDLGRLSELILDAEGGS
jgi:CRP-like cAMP-binding protein